TLHSHPRDLHPLPTRRSSDLEESEVRVAVRPEVGVVREKAALVRQADEVWRRKIVGSVDERREHAVTQPGKPVLGEELVEAASRSEEHTSELQSRENLVCRLL